MSSFDEIVIVFSIIILLLVIAIFVKFGLFIKWCKKGPPGAMVRNVELNWEQATGEYDTFSIEY